MRSIYKIAKIIQWQYVKLTYEYMLQVSIQISFNTNIWHWFTVQLISTVILYQLISKLMHIMLLLVNIYWLYIYMFNIIMLCLVKLYDHILFQNATHLEKRPFLHCTTVPIVLWILLILLSSIFHSSHLEHISWVVLAAFLSHHIRDSTRRGLWFCPFGSTRPLPYYLYVSLSMFLPYLLYWFSSLHTFAEKSKSNVALIDIWEIYLYIIHRISE